MIFDGQNEIHRLVRTLLIKLDEVIGRQERELSMLTLINQGSSGGQPQGGQVWLHLFCIYVLFDFVLLSCKTHSFSLALTL